MKKRKKPANFIGPCRTLRKVEITKSGSFLQPGITSKLTEIVKLANSINSKKKVHFDNNLL